MQQKSFNLSRYSVIKEAMMNSLAFGLSFLILAHFTISTWALMPFLEENLRLPIAAWYALAAFSD